VLIGAIEVDQGTDENGHNPECDEDN